jgi:hypothetical protein
MKFDEIISKTDAQSRVDQIVFFNKELENLESENILKLDEHQLTAITKYHDSVLNRLKECFDIDSGVRPWN